MNYHQRRLAAALAAAVLAGQLTLPAAAIENLDTGAAQDDLLISQVFGDQRLQDWLRNEKNLNGAGADGVLTWKERQEVTELNLSGLGLTSLEGLDAFPNLQVLDCSQNQLTRLDLSGCPNLTRVHCAYNRLESLDLSRNSLLKSLNCSFNRLKELDLSDHGALVSLYCEMNQLTALELAGCTRLTALYCRNNLLESLDLTDNTALEFIEIFSNSSAMAMPFPTGAHCRARTTRLWRMGPL